MNLRLCPLCQRLYPQGASSCPLHGRTLREDPLIGQTLCGHQVVGWLGEGLYLAVHPQTQALCGVRLLPEGASHLGGDLLPGLRQASARTDGAAVLPIDGGVLADGRPYYLFSWRPEHEPLSLLIARAPRPEREALEVAATVCAAALSARQAGFPGQPLRPETVIVRPSSDGSSARVALLDVGVLAAGTGFDEQDDVYSIGALLYGLLTGSTFETATAFSGAAEGISPECQAVVLRALARRREDRHESVAALHRDLQGLLAEARPAPPARSGQRPKALLLTAAVLGSMVTAAGIFLLLSLTRPDLMARSTGAVGARGPASGRGAPGEAPPHRLAPADRPADRTLVPPAVRAQALSVLSDALRSAEVDTRVRAASAVGLSRDMRLRPLAEELLADRDVQVAARAAAALGELGDRGAVVALGRAVGEKPLLLEVGVALLRLGDRRGLTLLGEALRGKDEAVRLEAAYWLGEQGEQDAWRVLRRMLAITQDEDPLRHLGILGRLCRGRDHAACQQLRDRLLAPRRAAAALSERGRIVLGGGLFQAGDPLGYQVLHEAKDKGDLRRRLAALRYLGEGGGLTPSDDAWLVEALATPSIWQGAALPAEEGRVYAADILGASAHAGAVPALSTALSDESRAVRIAAAAALLRISALEPARLISLSTDWAQIGIFAERPLTRAAAAAVLGLGPSALTGPLLLRALLDREADVRIAAARSLGRLDPSVALPALGQALSDRDGDVRVAALLALARLAQADARAGEQVAVLLGERLARGTLMERVAAAAILLQRGDHTHRFVLQQAQKAQDAAVRRMAIELGRRDPDPAQRAALFVAGLSDVAEEVRLAAAAALAAQGDRRGVEVLSSQGAMLLSQRLIMRDALMRLNEPVPSLDIVAVLGAAGEGQRVGAMAAAAQLLETTAVPLLRCGLRDVAHAVRLQAIASVLELQAEPRVRQQLLLEVLGDSDEAVRGRARGALGALLLAQPGGAL